MSKNATESVKIVDIEVENIHNFWMTWWIILKISGKMWLLKVLIDDARYMVTPVVSL